MVAVPYQPSRSGTAQEMVARSLSSTGSRAAGLLPVRAASVWIQRPTLSDLCCPTCATTVPYHTAKLGALGLSPFSQAAGTLISTARGASTGAAVGGSIVGAASAIGGAAAGAAAGSVVPIIGTAIGAIAGLLASGVFNRNDQEIGNWDQALAVYRQSGCNGVLQIANKYLILAGLFDLSSIHTNIPIYRKYGRMGEQRFVNDLCTTIYNAAQQGRITSNDTIQSIYNNIVLPWINSFGYGAMSDPNADMITCTIMGMMAEYVAGRQTLWLARSGDFPFGGLPQFSLPTPVAPPVVAAQTPAPAPVIAPTPAPAPVIVPQAQPGQFITPSKPGPLGTSRGTFLFDPVRGGWLKDGQVINSPSELLAIGVGPSGQVIGLYYNLGSLVWSGSQWSNLTGAGTYWGVTDPAWLTGQPPVKTVAPTPAPIVAPTPAPVTTVPATTQAIKPTAVTSSPAPTPAAQPVGFSQVGTDANGNPVFASPQGVLYTWNGASMVLFNGQLASGSSLAAQLQQAIQTALAQGQSQAQASQTALAQAQAAGVQVTPQVQQQVADQTAVTASAPPQQTSTTDSTSTYVMIGFAALAALFLLKGRRHA